MIKQFLIFLFFLVIGVLSFYTDYRLEISYLDELTQSAFTIAILYALFKLIFSNLIIKRIKEAKTAYRYRKTMGVLFYTFLFLALFRIWIEDPQALIVSYGIVAAGAAIALQDVLKNITGGLVIISNNLFRVGDRIEVNNSYGDVIDIGLFNTTMFEIGNWVKADQATGRLITIPNGVFLHKKAFNYTGDHEFIWDEIMIPITYDSDWKKASKVFKLIAINKTKEFSQSADKQLKRLSRKYYVTDRDTTPDIYVKTTDNWIELTVRYVVEAKLRRAVHNEMTKSILESFEKHKDIQIASQTIDIVGFKKK